MNLADLGWTQHFHEQMADVDGSLIPARVCRQDSDGYQLLWEDGSFAGTLAGRVRHEAGSRSAIPTVGDWVLVNRISGDADRVVIQRLLERSSAFSRNEAGTRDDEQIVAANIDTVFIVCGLDDNFSIPRMERFLLVGWNSGARPVILLNKSDLCDTLEARLAEVEQVAPDVDVIPISAIASTDLQRLMPYLARGNTVALLGSSGVGKSTIINNLLGYDHFDTKEVRASDSKGRHTTTRREMVALPSGGMIIDTPGMRELQIWGDESSLSRSYDDIEEIALGCRFNNCTHQEEPRCAVREAIKRGELDEDRLFSYLGFQLEIQTLNAQQEIRARLEKNKGGRTTARSGARRRPRPRVDEDDPDS